MERSPSGPASARGWLLAAAVFAALLPVLFHLRFLSGERIVYMADTAQLQYPRYRILCDALQQEGALPAWQTLVYGGAPFHANPEHPTLYPPVLLLARWCTPIWTINLTILGHLGLAGLGMLFLVRRIWSRIGGAEQGVALGGALVGACVFSLSYWTRVDHLNLVAYGATHALIPWVLLCADSLLHGPRPRRAAGWLGLLLGMLVLSGGLYVIPYAALALAAWMLFLGLLGGRESARRTLTWGVLAAGIALLLVGAKLLPYREWVGTTNRAGELSYAEALGTTLGGDRGFAWSEVWNRVRMYTFHGTTIALALLSLPLLRHAAVRLAWGLALLCFAIGLGGPAHRAVFELLPLFDQTRSAVRAWTGVNVFLAFLAGLGACWVLARVRPLRERAPRATLAGAMVAVSLAPFLCYSFRFDPFLRNPDRAGELLARYVQWPEAARRSGSEWRAMWIDKPVPEDRNEQFVTSLLGVETPAGYLGHVWPAELERHLYGPPEARLEDAVRFRRRATLSVRWMVTNAPDREPNPRASELVPFGVDGNAVVENPLARPRAFRPAVVVAVHDDAASAVAYALLDAGTFPLQGASVVQLERDRELSEGELRSLDALVLRGEPSRAALLAAQALRAAGKPVVEVGATFSDDDRRELHDLGAEIARLSIGRTAGTARFERLRSNATRVERDAAAGPGWIVVSEPWAHYAGWRARSDGGEELAIARADGMSSAVFLRGSESGLVAEYAPRSIRDGLVLYALGLLAALITILWPRRRASVAEAEPATP